MEGKKETLEDLKMTRDEFERITDALKNEEFRKLFAEYCEEISDPENRKKYEEEIKVLESQRGVDCKFVHPYPGYVIKTTDGEQKVFINVAKNELVEKPKCERVTGPDGTPGFNWSLPMLQAPPRKDMDTKHQWCTVYDVIFHPETLKMAECNDRFRKMVNDTAIDAVTQTFKIKLDTTNQKFPKLTYKGTPKPTVLRKQVENPSKLEDLGPLKDMMPPVPQKKKTQIIHQVERPTDSFTVPKHTIKFRKNLEMHEFTGAYDAKIASALPTNIIVEIHLPLIKTAADVELDVSSSRLYLCSHKPAKYKLEVKLPYEVDDANGSARFDHEKRSLIADLPVVQPRIGVPEIIERRMVEEVEIEESESSSKDESDTESLNVEKDTTLNDTSKYVETLFFDEDIQYQTPTFISSLHNDDRRMILTLDSKNVDPGTLEFRVKEDQEIQVKYSSVGAGYFPIYFGLTLKLENGAYDHFNALVYSHRVRLIFDFTQNLTTDFGLYYGPAFGVLEFKQLNEMMAEDEDEEAEPIDFDLDLQHYTLTATKIEFECASIATIQK